MEKYHGIGKPLLRTALSKPPNFSGRITENETVGSTGYKMLLMSSTLRTISFATFNEDVIEKVIVIIIFLKKSLKVIFLWTVFKDF